MVPRGLLYSLDFKTTPEELSAQAIRIIEKYQKSYDEVAAVKEDEVTFDNVLKVLGDSFNVYINGYHYFEHANMVAVEKRVREASSEAMKKLSEFARELCMREDVFKRLEALDKKQPILDAESKRYLERLIRDGKRNGLDLSMEKREELKSLRTEIEKLCSDFITNLNEDNTTVEFTEEELDGVPKDFIEELEKCPDTNKRKLSMRYPHYCPVLKKAHNPETRKRMAFAYGSRLVDPNAGILEKVCDLRHKQANLLGFPTHAAFQCDILMSKSVENVAKFLADMANWMKPLWEVERKELLELKEKDCKELGIPFNGKLDSYDMSYLLGKMKELKYSIDEEALRSFFPLPVVTKGLLKIYETLLSLKFTKVENPVVCHEDIEMYSVEDALNGNLRGYFYLDLFPREGKWSHFSTGYIQTSCELPDGSRQLCACAAICNFTKPTANKPSLLAFDEVVTLFHEFGHVMHHLCSETKYSIFYGTRVESDFLEAPSQMLENWCYDPVTLRMMSAHYETNEPIPDHIIDSLVKARRANVAYRTLRQYLLASLDQKIHSTPQLNIAAVYRDLSEEVFGISPIEGTNFASHFMHLAHNYDAKYYSYKWSKVYSMDMFYTRFKKNLLDPVIGKEYRDKVISRGGSKVAIDMLRDFLGREPNQEAYLVSIGLKQE